MTNSAPPALPRPGLAEYRQTGVCRAEDRWKRRGKDRVEEEGAGWTGWKRMGKVDYDWQVRQY